jgi:hypothetical protein
VRCCAVKDRVVCPRQPRSPDLGEQLAVPGQNRGRGDEAVFARGAPATGGRGPPRTCHPPRPRRTRNGNIGAIAGEMLRLGQRVGAGGRFATRTRNTPRRSTWCLPARTRRPSRSLPACLGGTAAPNGSCSVRESAPTGCRSTAMRTRSRSWTHMPGTSMSTVRIKASGSARRHHARRPSCPVRLRFGVAQYSGV